MLDAPSPVSAEVFATPRVYRLAGDVGLVIWDLPNRVWSAPQLRTADGATPSPLASLRLNLEAGGTRILWAFRRSGEEAIAFRVSAGAIAVEADVEASAELQPLAPAGLAGVLDGLSRPARVSLITALLNAWPGIFKLARSRAYVAFLYAFLKELNASPPPAAAVASVGMTRLFEMRLAAGGGTVSGMHLVGPLGLVRLQGDAYRCETRGDGRHTLVIAADLERLPSDGYLVLSGPWGVAVRQLELADAGRSLAEWWKARPRKDGALRDHVVTSLGARSPAARAAVLELQLSEPLAPRGLSGESGLPSAAVDLALAGRSGVLVVGRSLDQLGMIEGLDLLDPSGAAHPLALHRFSGRKEEGRTGPSPQGFLAFSDSAGLGELLLQPRFTLRLASGGQPLLVPPPQPNDIGEIRTRALTALPPQQVTDTILAECIAPALADIQERMREAVGAPEVVTIGTRPERPAVSIIVPLYRVMEYLKAQYAAFAIDRQIVSEAEVIYVLDSPEQAEEVEHLLRGLHLLHGLPVTLAVMPRNAGYALACNAGADLARGAVLAMLNSDVIPRAPGWLGMLAARLDSRRVGAVGAKLLYEDHSIQHAGLYFIEDHKGRWLNHHYFKGLPRDFAPAQVGREVPAVTGACLVLTSRLFTAVGGFTTDYVIGDYEDSDLCLKIRARGYSIHYVPEAELYHLERRSSRASADYVRGVASQYNRGLHQQRWQQTIAALATGSDSSASEREAA